jgi:hypothetical protein
MGDSALENKHILNLEEQLAEWHGGQTLPTAPW